MKILIVDDDKDIVELLSIYLKNDKELLMNMKYTNITLNNIKYLKFLEYF